MPWLLIYVAGGYFTADVKIERVSEAQCKAIVEVAPDKERVRCLSPIGEWYPAKPSK